jgi:transcriptional accessory protein Tex/SPT6
METEREGIRINLANHVDLCKLPGIGREQARAIVRWRAEHGPIANAEQLRRILSPWPIDEALWDRVDFAPAHDTAPEAPGA